MFSALANSSDSEFEAKYSTGLWGAGKKYLNENLPERLTEELADLEKWLEPTDNEERTRLIVINMISNFIEAMFPSYVVIPQGSSATNTYLPTSDIDLIITQVPENIDVANILRQIVRSCWKAKIISNGFVIAHARVPIAKLTDRVYRYHIDIAVGNVNGVLNIPRVLTYMDKYPILKPVLMFLKLLCFINNCDDPATGGFGSTHLIQIVLFGLQSKPNVKNPGELLIHILKTIGTRINYYFVGISTIGNGCLFSKRKADQLDHRTPQALVFEDPQMQNIFIGARTTQTPKLANLFQNVLESFESDNFLVKSNLQYIFPNLSEVMDRRNYLENVGSLLDEPNKSLIRFINSIPESERPNSYEAPPQRTTISRSRSAPNVNDEVRKMKHGNKAKGRGDRKRKRIEDSDVERPQKKSGKNRRHQNRRRNKAGNG